MLRKQVKIVRWPRPAAVDGFEYVIAAANGLGIAIMCQKGKKGLVNAVLMKDAINQYLNNQD